MNIRKNIDYSEMYETLNMLMAQQLPQMELYCEIGKAVCRRIEKGAAVMASEYLHKNYPDVKGFSPRSIRRMRDFYRTYENYPALLSCAMHLGWIQNVVIMEADLTMDLRKWYMRAAKRFGWSKTELIANIVANVHEDIVLADDEYNINLKTINIESHHSEKKIDLRFLRRNNTANSGQVDQKALEIYKDIDLSLREKYYAEMGLNIIWVDDFDEIPQILKGLL